MAKIVVVSRMIRLLLVAAVLLPLVFMAEVVYVERPQLQDTSQQEQAEALAQRRQETEAVWLKNQAAYVRGLARLCASDINRQELVTADFHSFLTDDFLVLGYADKDGSIQLDTSGGSGRNISGRNFFVQAIGGREFTGQEAGADWLLQEEVTVIAIPVTAGGGVAGVVYGVISRDLLAAVAAKLVPPVTVLPDGKRWLLWLAGVYAAGLIPLLLLAWLLSRQSEVQPALAERRQQQSSSWEWDSAGTAAAAPGKTPEAAAVEKIAEMIALSTAGTTAGREEKPAVVPAAVPAVSQPDAARQQAANQPLAQTQPAPEKPAVPATPAMVIDRVLAAAAYQGSRAAAQKAPPLRQAPEPVAVKPDLPSEAVLPATPAAVVAGEPEAYSPPEPAVDELTGFATRSAFQKTTAGRRGRQGEAILVLGIDGIKVINDYLGAQAGDELITITADILKVLGGFVCAARIDGDRFAALLTGIVPDKLDDVQADIKYYIDLHNLRRPELPLSATVGITAAAPGESLAAVWEQAEGDMERQKTVNRVNARKFIMLAIKRYRRNPSQR